MKKVIFGIFAHPDDEAFGPASTLLRETRGGAELHLITLTPGQNGPNPDNRPNLGEIRLKEWQKSSELIGASSISNLGYVDGELNNTTLVRATKEIETIVSDIVRSHVVPVEVDFISMDTNGITGHIDHIVVSYIAHLVFYRLKQEKLPLARLRLACIPREQTGDQPNTDFVYMEPGRLGEEIDEIIDNTDLYDEVVEIMRCHYTQRDDCEYHLRKLGNKVAVDHFIVKQ